VRIGLREVTRANWIGLQKARGRASRHITSSSSKPRRIQDGGFLDVLAERRNSMREALQHYIIAL